MDKKENYDKMLKNNRVEKKTDGVESDRELRKALLISVFLSLSIILQIAESFIFIPLFLPGIKLGLANIVTIIVLYVYGIKERTGKFSIMGVSIAGANFHMIGQIVVASAVYRTNLLYVSYLPYMLLISLFTGMLTGYFAEKIMERVDFKSF